MHKKLFTLLTSAFIVSIAALSIVAAITTHAQTNATTLAVSFSPNTPVAQSLPVGKSYVELARFDLTAQGGDVNVKKLILTRIGASKDSDVVKVWLIDRNANTTVGYDTYLSNGTALFTSPFTVYQTKARSIAVMTDISNNATVGNTVGFSINTAMDISATVSAQEASVSGAFPVKASLMTISSTTTNQPPVISGVSGPTSLKVNETGTWTITAKSSNTGGTLAYIIEWGDVIGGGVQGSSSQVVDHSSSFTHQYAKQGVYTITITVKDNYGASEPKTLKVTVSESPALLPDLIVSDVLLDPAFPKGNEMTKYTAVVVNYSSIPITTPFKVNLGGVASTIFQLGPNESTKVYATFALNIPGANKIVASADYENTVAESKESNNDFFQEVMVSPTYKGERKFNLKVWDTVQINSGLILRVDGKKDGLNSVARFEVYDSGYKKLLTTPDLKGGESWFSNGNLPSTLSILILAFPESSGDFVTVDINYRDSTNNQPPVITGVSGPTSLKVNENGIWAVTASDPEGAFMTYSADWGDTTQTTGMYPSSGTKSFNHSYAQSGTYTVALTVTDDKGASAKSTVSVKVSDTIETLPDLYISQDFTISPTLAPTQGEPISSNYIPANKLITITYKIINGGNATANLSGIGTVTGGTIKPDGGFQSFGSDCLSSTSSVSKIAPKDYCTANATFILTQAGTYSIIFEVAPSDALVESDKRNNTLTIPVTVKHQTSSQPPVISGVSGPTSLKVGETGTWSVTASDPENGTLSYKVNWGNVDNNTSASSSAEMSQIATFTHSYAQSGTYTITFTVTDDKGASAKSNISVKILDDGISCTMEYKPVCGVNGKTYPNRCDAETINKVKVDYEGECRPSIPTPKPPAPNVTEIRARAELLSDNRIEILLAEIKELRNQIREQDTKIKYLEKLTRGVEKISQKTEERLNTFIAYGVDENTKKLGTGERAAVLYSYQYAFDKLPESENELNDAILIANGRWPNERSEEAEVQAKKSFEEIYLREPDMNNPNDSAAVMIMAYGLKQQAKNRNLMSEGRAIATFRSIYKRTPTSTKDWNKVQAIAYSGARR